MCSAEELCPAAEHCASWQRGAGGGASHQPSGPGTARSRPTKLAHPPAPPRLLCPTEEPRDLLVAASRRFSQTRFHVAPTGTPPSHVEEWKPTSGGIERGQQVGNLLRFNALTCGIRPDASLCRAFVICRCKECRRSSSSSMFNFGSGMDSAMVSERARRIIAHS